MSWQGWAELFFLLNFDTPKQLQLIVAYDMQPLFLELYLYLLTEKTHSINNQLKKKNHVETQSKYLVNGKAKTKQRCWSWRLLNSIKQNGASSNSNSIVVAFNEA